MVLISNILHGRKMAADGDFLVKKSVFWKPPQVEDLDNPNNLLDAVRVWAKGLTHVVGPREFHEHGFYGALAHNFIEYLRLAGVNDPPKTVRDLHARHPKLFRRWVNEKQIRPEIYRAILREYEDILQKKQETV